MNSGVVSRCFLALAFIALAPPFFNETAKAAAAADTMPLAFDPREKVAKPDLKSITRLRFLTSVDFPPFNFIDQSGKLSGFHVDLAREICAELGITDRCQIEAQPYDALTADLDKGEGEVVAAGTRINEDLRKDHNFSRVYLQIPARFVALKRNAGANGDPSQLAPGETGVVAATAHEAMAKAFFPQLRPKTFIDRAALLGALKRGEIKAAFGDSLQLSFWLESADAADCCAFLGGPYYSRQFLGDGMALMSAKSNPLVTDAIDSALVALARNGRLAELYLRYFPSGL